MKRVHLGLLLLPIMRPADRPLSGLMLFVAARGLSCRVGLPRSGAAAATMGA